MKEDIILIGGGGHCKSCIDIIEEEGQYTIKGIVDIPKKIGHTILGYPIIDSDNNLEAIVKKYKYFFITIGFIKTPILREKLFKRIISLGGEFPVIIAPKAHVSKHAKIDSGTIVMHGVIINANAIVGKNCIINNLSLLEHDTEIGNNTHVSTGVRVNGDCKIGSRSFIGSGTVINQGVQIYDDIIIGSGSLVRKDIVKEGMYSGNPLKRYK